MASETEYFLATKPVYPWSEYPLGPPALALVATVLVGITLWTYWRHTSATRRRVGIILILRISALAIALLTTLRPSIGIQEDPKIPSILLIGIDFSESMTIKDELNSQRRIDAVKRTMEKIQPTLEELQSEQNIQVVLYSLGKTDFDEANDRYAADRPADAKRSDYGVYLNRTLEKWQSERFIRGHFIIGDGADNGTSFAALSEANRWRSHAPISTFAVGSTNTQPDAKDVGIVAVSIEPIPVPIKNNVTVKVIVNAFGFSGARVPIRLYFNDQKVAEELVLLRNETGNEIVIQNKELKAPETPGEVKVKVEIPVDRVPGDIAPANNSVETYMTVSKDGVRLLLVDRLRVENSLIRDVLRAERRFDLVQVLRQRDEPSTPDERELFDFDSKAYDVIIIGNISGRQLDAIDPKLMSQLRDQVLKKGAGLLFLGGDASYLGNPANTIDNGFRGTPLEQIMPVSLTQFPSVPERLYTSEDQRFQSIPTLEGLRFLMRVGTDESVSKQLWDKLNEAKPPTRMTAVSKMGNARPGATVFALASPQDVLIPSGIRSDQQSVGSNLIPLLVGWQQGQGANPGRVLAFAGHDTYLWKPLGMRSQPRTREGQEIHAQFWRRLILWLAKQEEEEGAAYARPEFRRIPVRGKQSIKVGLRQSGGADAIDPDFKVRVLAPGQKPEEAVPRVVTVDPKRGHIVAFDPQEPGEYTVLLSATGKDSNGKDVKGDASARFLAYAEVSDEMLRSAADFEYLDKLAKNGGGKFYRLEDLPIVLKEMKSQKLELEKKPRFVPDWRRTHSGGFLPSWLILFVVLLGLEWGLRRIWGMV